MALRVSMVLLRSLLLVLAFLLVSGLNLGPGPGPFLRSKRANSFLEEIFQGNLERECHEELCNYEEAREVFEDDHQTAKFWASYYDGDQCESAPCGNGGNCTDRVGGFFCTCPAPFYGDTCEMGPESRPKTESDLDLDDVLHSSPQHRDPAGCRTSGPSSCEQLCTASGFSFSCSCLTGFKLQSDGRRCEPEVEFPCGQIPDQLQSNSSHSVCTDRKCPWQVSVLDWRGVQLCWGALLGHNLVLTSAHCLQSQLRPDLDPKQIFIRVSGQRRALQVRSVDVHERFSLGRHDYDFALLQTPRPLHLGPALFHLCVPTHRDHAENVLMHAGKPLLIGGRGSAARSVSLEECRGNNVSHGLSNKMFCLETKRELNQDLKTKPGLNQDQRTKPGLGQDQDRTMDRTMDHSQDLKRASESSNNQSNKETDDTEAQNGHRQGLNMSEIRLTPDKEKVHPHMDQPGLNLDHIKPTKPRPSQDQQRVDLHFPPNKSDQDQSDHLGQKQDQSGLRQAELPVPELGSLGAPAVDGPLQGAPAVGAVDGPLGGTPVVSVDHGTAFLVGLLTSASPAGGSGTQVLVFTKVSRHMTWLQQRLGHVTPLQGIPRP